MARKTTKTVLSVSEFRSWLEGVEDMQGDDWSPDLSQWKKIRGKIELLEEVDYSEVLAEMSKKQPTVVNNTQMASPRPPAFPAGPSFLDDGGPKLTTVMPSPPSSIIGSTKTPDIDTSGGMYPGAFV